MRVSRVHEVGFHIADVDLLIRIVALLFLLLVRRARVAVLVRALASRFALGENSLLG